MNEPKEGPLTPFKGAKPPAPQWFDKAIAQEPERRMIPVRGANIEAISWGEKGNPGLLLMHGNSAHADWYSFIAPFWADRYRVTSMSWSGMGGSDWRETYDLSDFAAEALEVAEETGVFDGKVKPVFIAHSFGGLTLRYLSVAHGDRIAGAISLDSRTDMMRHKPGETHPSQQEMRRPGPPERNRPNNVYPTFEAALARFRLAPPQPCENLFLVDYIARRSLKEAPMPDGSGMGWTWKFDPFLFRNMTGRDSQALWGDPTCPVAMIWGSRSMVMQMGGETARKGATAPLIALPDSGHHVMLDQPLALVSAIDALLEAWPAGFAR